MNVRRRQRGGDVGEVSAAGRQGCGFLAAANSKVNLYVV